MENNYDILKKELQGLWGAERAEVFIEKVVEAADRDQMDCLTKMIGYVEEEIEDLTEERLFREVEGMDTFDGPMEFLEYFFKMTQPELANGIAQGLKEDPEEMEVMLESMEDSGLIQYIVEMDAFYVWYRG